LVGCFLVVSLLDLPASLAPSLPEKVSSIITNGQWDLPQVLISFPLVTNRIIKTIIPISLLQDRLIWLHSFDCDLSSKHAFAFLRPSAGVLPSVALIWRVSITPSHSFIFWRLMHDKMPTYENLLRRGCTVVSVCVLCLQNFETLAHLFLRYPLASHLWTWLRE